MSKWNLSLGAKLVLGFVIFTLNGCAIIRTIEDGAAEINQTASESSLEEDLEDVVE